jgi:hypothetical protein
MSHDPKSTTPFHESDTVEYQVLWNLLDRGRVVPFLGAGASLGGLSGNESSDDLPTGKQLAIALASKLELSETEVDSDDLIEVASCFELLADRHYLEDTLKTIFGRAGRPGPLHRFIATLKAPARVIVTTNYDTLIEQAFRQANRAFHLVMTPVDAADKSALLWWGPGESVARVERPERAFLEPPDITTIYKIHGGVAPNGEWITSVVTENDYFTIGGRTYASQLIPIQIADALHDSSLLFLGYSLRDIHVRFLIGQSARWSRKRHRLVAKAVTRIDRLRFDRLGVSVIELTIMDFLERLNSARAS